MDEKLSLAQKLQKHRKLFLGMIFIAALCLVIFTGFYLGFFQEETEKPIIKKPQQTFEQLESPQPIEYSSKLGEVIDEALREIGIPEADITITRTERMDHNKPRIVTRRKVDVPTIYPLAYCNLIITKAIKKDGGNVLSAVESTLSNDSRKKVNMDIGEGDIITQQIILNEKINPQDIFSVPKFDKPGKIAIVIDDFGYSYSNTAQAFLRINRPLAISILPDLPHSKTIAKDAPLWNKEVLLHLPMEANNPYQSPGEYGIYMNSTSEDISKKISKSLSKMPQVIGINNHMGSKVTRDKTMMTAVLSEIKKHDKFFLDSMTASDSVGWKTAKEMGIPTAKNRGFIDNEINVRAIKREIIKIARMASEDGTAIAIGHSHYSTLKAIQEIIPLLEKQGFEFIYVSELVQ